MFETRIRVEKQSKLSEIIAPTPPSRYEKVKKNRKSRKTDFQNSNQNRKAVKTERDGRSHTKFEIKKNRKKSKT